LLGCKEGEVEEKRRENAGGSDIGCESIWRR